MRVWCSLLHDPGYLMINHCDRSRTMYSVRFDIRKQTKILIVFFSTDYYGSHLHSHQHLGLSIGFLFQVFWLKICKVTGLIADEFIGFSSWPNPSSRIMGLGSTQPLTEISTRNLPGGKGGPAPKVDNPTASTSHNSMGLHGLLHE
jgi:hypothetical protein